MKKTLALLLAVTMCLSFTACGSSVQKKDSSADTNQAIAEKNSDMIEFDGIIVADDMNVTIELVSFYSEEINWSNGAQNEKIISLRFMNKTDHEIVLNPGNFYINDEKVYVSMCDGSVSLEAGRAGKYSYLVAEDTNPEHTALKNLDELYALEGSFSGLHIYEDSQKNTRLEVSFSIPKAINGEVIAMATPDLKKYGNVVNALAENTWYFNGGGDSVLNALTFSDASATIAQISYDGNGKHTGDDNLFAYTIDDAEISIVLADGSTLAIPYTYADGAVVLESGTYFTAEDIIDGLQGFWTLDDNNSFGHSIHNVYINGNQITSEKATEARNGAPGEYFWYGGDGYTGTFTLNFGGIDTDMKHGSEWFFNVIDGKPMLLHYDNVCSRANITRLPGENGYSFK